MYGLHLNNRNNQQNVQQNGNHAQQGEAADQNAVQAQPAGGNAAAPEGGAALGFQPYIRPPMFAFKVT